jgi:hypothetical protein
VISDRLPVSLPGMLASLELDRSSSYTLATGPLAEPGVITDARLGPLTDRTV